MAKCKCNDCRMHPAILLGDSYSGEPRPYNIVRFYQKGGRRTIQARVTLEEAQAHCGDPETSSRTCTSSEGRRRTQRLGPWFDGYEER